MINVSYITYNMSVSSTGNYMLVEERDRCNNGAIKVALITVVEIYGTF
jgi:hypothetical protein